jgi:hypothetical protein
VGGRIVVVGNEVDAIVLVNAVVSALAVDTVEDVEVVVVLV